MRKQTKKLLSWVLTGALVLSTVNIVANDKAEAEAAASFKSFTVEAGKWGSIVPTGDAVTVDDYGEYTVQGEALDDYENIFEQNVYLETDLDEEDADFGKTYGVAPVKVSVNGTEVPWEKITPNNDPIQFGVHNPWNDAIQAAENQQALACAKGDIVEFTFNIVEPLPEAFIINWPEKWGNITVTDDAVDIPIEFYDTEYTIPGEATGTFENIFDGSAGANIGLLTDRAEDDANFNTTYTIEAVKITVNGEVYDWEKAIIIPDVYPYQITIQNPYNDEFGWAPETQEAVPMNEGDRFEVTFKVVKSDTPGGDTPGGDTPGGDTPGGSTGGNTGGNTGGTNATPTPTPTASAGATVTNGQTVTSKNITYKVTNASKKTVTVTKVSKKVLKAKKITVPNTVKVNGVSCKVTAIGKNAFKGSKATTITLGKNVKTIAKGAFANCKKLKTLKVQGKLTKVAKGAFKGCKKKIAVKGAKKSKKANVKALKKSGYKKFK